MPLTSDTVEELDRLLDIFFEKIGRKERLRKQILKLMDECEAYLYPKIREWMQLSRKQIIRDIKNRILKFEKKSKPQIVVDYVDWETIESSGKSIIKPAYLNVMQKAGNVAYKQGKIVGSFDVINPRSVTWAEKYSSELVTLVGKETKKGLREIVTQGVKEGKTLKGIAKDIEKMGIGLNGRQTKALYKYRDLMEAQKLPSKVIKDKFDKYYNRLLRERSEMISRTEVNRSVNEGYLDSLEGTRYEEVEISSAGDACHLCLDMAGIRYKRAEARGRLPVHPDCRCHWIVVIPRVKKPKVPKKPAVPEKPLKAAEARKKLKDTYRRELAKIQRLESDTRDYSSRAFELKRAGMISESDKYHDLYEKTKKEIRMIEEAVNQKMRKLLYVTDKGFALDPEWSIKETPFFKNGLTEFTKLIDEKVAKTLSVRIAKTGRRGYYHMETIYIDAQGIAFKDTGQIIHELGHWLEDINPEMKKSILAFYKERTKGEPLIRLIDSYRADELYKKDKFMDPYMGKDYQGTATEILSMGLQSFYQRPYELATRDPRYFDFIYNIVRGKY